MRILSTKFFNLPHHATFNHIIKNRTFQQKNNIPCLGICFGMQLMIIEFARNVLGIKDANSTEINPNTSYPVIDLLSSTKDASELGGSMRLGNMICNIKKDTKLFSIYKESYVYERFRHRYGFSKEYISDFENHGVVFSGIGDNDIIEAMELSDKKWFIGVQYHPEFNSTPLNPSPLFKSFISAIISK